MRKFDQLLLIGLLALVGLLLPHHAGAQGKPFIMKWDVHEWRYGTTLLEIPIYGDFSKYALRIEWENEDGTERQEITVNDVIEKFSRKNYKDKKIRLNINLKKGIYLVKVYCESAPYRAMGIDFSSYHYNDQHQADWMYSDELLEIVSWGDFTWEKISFYGCKSLTIAPTAGKPNIVLMKDLRGMFQNCWKVNPDLNDWDVRHVTRMDSMFYGCRAFNQPLDKWDVSNVTGMNSMFSGCQSFNQPLEGWNVSKVEDMGCMFDSCYAFNQPLEKWNLSHIRQREFKAYTSPYPNGIEQMLHNCKSFNQPIEKLDLKYITSIAGILAGCTAFNQPIEKWNLSNVEKLDHMLSGCTSFNQPVENLKIRRWATMKGMLSGCTAFNQPIEKWDLSNVKTLDNLLSGCTSFNQPVEKLKITDATIKGMLSGCTAFNQPIEKWDLSNVEKLNNLLSGCTSFNQPLENLTVRHGATLNGMLRGCKSFNQPLEKWDVGHVKDMAGILDSCTAFNQPLANLKFSMRGDSSYNKYSEKWDRDYVGIGFAYSGISRENYEATLATWAKNVKPKQELVWVEAAGVRCNCKNEAKQKLVKNNKWEIVDYEECIEIIGNSEVGVGGRAQLKVKFNDLVTAEEQKDRKNFPHMWTSGDKSIAEVDAYGEVRGIAEGETTIFVRSLGAGGWNAEHKIRVISVHVDSVVLDQTEVTMGTSGSVQLTAHVYPEDAKRKDLTWELYNGFGTVSNTGLVRVHRAGFVTVRAVAMNGKESRWCWITVVQDPTEVQLSQHEMTMLVGDNPVQLTATVMPDKAVDKSITWSVEPSDVASVSAEGLVTPLKGGTAHVFATAHNGVKGECVVTVKEFMSVTEVAVAPKSMSMSLGDAPVQLTANVKPEEATIKTISWVTEPVDIVKVENGLVSPLKAGTAKVIAISHNKISGECLVTVIDPANPTPPTPNPGTNPTPNQKTAVDGGLPRVEVAPNPFSTTLTVLHAEDVQRYELVDAGGAIVAKGRNQSAMLTIPTDHLVPGVYVLRLVGAEGARNIRVVKR